MITQQGPKDFDLPINHLPGDALSFIPRPAFEADEIDRRKELPKGTLLLEHQAEGLGQTVRLLEAVQDVTQLGLLAGPLSEAALNTTAYTIGRGCLLRADRVQRRRLKIPIMRPTDAEPTAEPHYYRALDLLRSAASYAVDVREEHILRKPRLMTLNVFGRTVGAAAMELSLLKGITPEREALVAGLSAQEAQYLARQKAATALAGARRPVPHMSTVPSLAQLGDPLSDLSVHVARKTGLVVAAA